MRQSTERQNRQPPPPQGMIPFERGEFSFSAHPDPDLDALVGDRPDGPITLRARAWAVRGVVPSRGTAAFLPRDTRSANDPRATAAQMIDIMESYATFDALGTRSNIPIGEQAWLQNGHFPSSSPTRWLRT